MDPYLIISEILEVLKSSNGRLNILMIRLHRFLQYLIEILLVDAKQLTIGWKMETPFEQIENFSASERKRVKENSRGKFIFQFSRFYFFRDGFD